MRTLIIIVAGFALWALSLGVGRLLSDRLPSAMAWSSAVFVLLWFLAAAINMGMGVTRAGYSVKEELPIFLLIFLLPAAVAMLVRWKFFTGGA